MSCKQRVYESPIGTLVLVGDDERLFGVFVEGTWAHYARRFGNSAKGDSPVLRKTAQQLDEYFAGRRRTFELPLVIQGTPFQNKAWRALGRIPYGQTKTYKEQAEAIESPRALRAVGRANGLNPFSVVLPCHRVVGSGGALTGYAGGLEAKKFLLRLEGSELGGQ